MLGTQPETFSILLHAEEVEVVKRVCVSEEVVISKKARGRAKELCDSREA